MKAFIILSAILLSNFSHADSPCMNLSGAYHNSSLSLYYTLHQTECTKTDWAMSLSPNPTNLTTLLLDGNLHQIPNSDGSMVTATTDLNGMSVTYTSSGSVVFEKDVFSLDSSGNLVVVETAFQNGSPSFSQTVVFTRVQ